MGNHANGSGCTVYLHDELLALSKPELLTRERPQIDELKRRRRNGLAAVVNESILCGLTPLSFYFNNILHRHSLGAQQ